MQKYLVVFQSVAERKKIAFVVNAPTQFAAERDAWDRLEAQETQPKEKYFLYSKIEISMTMRQHDIDKLIEEHTRIPV